MILFSWGTESFSMYSLKGEEEEQTNKKQNNCDSFTSRAKPLCRCRAVPFQLPFRPSFSLDQTKKSRVFNNVCKDKRLQVSQRTFVS